MTYVEGQHKKYSQEDSDRSDPTCRRVSAEFLMQRSRQFYLDVPLDEQPNCYGDWDFQIMYGTTRMSVETEHKLGWISNDGTFLIASPKCPEGRIYPTVDVSGRKSKSIADIFIMCNRNYDALCMTDMKNVIEANRRDKDTSVGTKQEAFFKVRKDLFKFYVLRDGIWQKVN